jgi:hypothetical protein
LVASEYGNSVLLEHKLYRENWGEGTTSSAAVTDSNGAGTAAGSHGYGQGRSFTITLIVTDNDGLVNGCTVQVQVMAKEAAAIQAIKDFAW